MSQKPFVYLCGPIDGHTHSSASIWRSAAATRLAPEFEVLNPLRGHEFEGTDWRGKFTLNEVVTRDLTDIRRARVVLRHFDSISSEGSAMETFFAAHVCGLPVVTFGTTVTREGLPGWLQHHTVRHFALLNEAVAYVKAQYLLPGEEVEPAYDVRLHLDGPEMARRLVTTKLDSLPNGRYPQTEDGEFGTVQRFGTVVPKNTLTTP